MRKYFGVLVVVLLASCAPKQSVHGNLVLSAQWNKVIVGETTHDEVVQILGSPSTVATFDNNIWFYVGRRLTQTAFLEPEVEDYQALLVAFNDSGIVQRAEKFTQEDLNDIDMLGDVTPTSGREINAFEQVLGNFGRFTGK